MSMAGAVDISVITPSFNMLGYLKRCCASVADQGGPSHEHIVVDGMSTDGTIEWLKKKEGIRCLVEPDNGMYDAVNKGLDLSRGAVVSYLNCDEQYLPGTLAFVSDFFQDNPDVDILFGDFLVVRPDGSLLAYRKAIPPRWFYFCTAHLYLFTCTMFFRRRILDGGMRFNSAYKAVADEEFVVQALRNGHKAKYVRRYMAAFTFTGENRSQTVAALEERRLMRRSVPLWVTSLQYPLAISRYAEKVLHGAYNEKMPFEYFLYSDTEPLTRKRFHVESATWKWPGK